MKKIALIFLCSIALFTACSDDSSSNVKGFFEDSDIIAKTHDDLPICSDTQEGTFVYVKDEKRSYICQNNVWTPEESSQESSSSKTEDDSSSSEASSSETNDTQEPTSSATDEPSSSETEDSSSDTESSSSAEPDSSVESSSSEKAPIIFAIRDINVGVYQYEFSDMDNLNLVIYNNEEQAISDLTFFLYVSGKPENIEPVSGDGDQPGTCPLIIDEDICLIIDSAGFDSPCKLTDGTDANNTLRDNFRRSIPKQLEYSYNASTGEYAYYIPVSLGDLEIPPLSRLRIDINFSSGIYQNNMCETLRTKAKKELNSTSGGWSWIAHQKDVDGADYDGIPLWEKDQGDTEKAPINPYITLYIGNELIFGIPPTL